MNVAPVGRSGRSVCMNDSKKEYKMMYLDEMTLRILEEKGTATASEISAEIEVPVEDVKRALSRLETAGLLLLVM